jgi:pimeloyl-ACP methyl ester carboxylesterase
VLVLGMSEGLTARFRRGAGLRRCTGYRLWPRIARRLVSAGCVLLAVTAAGCAGISTHEARLRNAIEDRRERIEATSGLSGASGAVLARHGLVDAAANDPAKTAHALGARIQAQPEPNGALAMAELSYQAGLAKPRQSPLSALPWFRDAAAFAAMALAEPGGAQPEVAVRIHNEAVARIIRISQDQAAREGRNWREILADNGFALGTPAPHLDPQRIADLTVAGDLHVKGMDHLYYTPGLGVPVVAHRLADPSQSLDPRDHFLPREFRTGATAVVLPEGDLLGGGWRNNPVSLVLFDPVAQRSLVLGTRAAELAGDRTTPLAAEVARSQLATLELAGLLEPGFPQIGAEAGLYMLRPYEPGKIPVVLVHGLFSSPRAWAQTINELQNTPSLAARYQFWVFLYPTGLPIPLSAARLRESLARAKETVDPGHADIALDQMVLVGHSMGGLLSKMMVQDSGFVLWDSAITVPHDQFKASPELRKRFDETLVFRPLPFVRRVVFIATPHRGSPLANDLLGQVVSRLVRPPNDLAKYREQIETLNGPNVISRELRRNGRTAIGNLRTDSPILAALDNIPIDQSVPYHSIIPLVGGVTGTDGVVEYRSSHLDGVASEMTLPGTHFSQEKIEVTQELRRILLEHLRVTGPTVVIRDGS